MVNRKNIMEVKEMIQFLNQESIQVIYDSEQVFSISHTSCKIYFWNGGFYNSYEENDERLISVLSSIVRIEKKIDSEFYPIWTKEDGIINQNENFVKLNGKYYTIKFLELLIEQIREFKKINI